MVKTMNITRGCWAPILAYIEQQFDAYLEGETRVQRVEVITINMIITIITFIIIIIIIITITINVNIAMITFTSITSFIVIISIFRSRIPWSMLAFTS